ncbi:McrC family protein [Micrococcus endophyticus]|uniref:McrC family protein n=1 Tax=Micrococcus endophyticus TaxID=455343 RepID=UPI003827EA8F
MDEGIANVFPGTQAQWEVQARNVAGVVSFDDLVVEIAPKLRVAQVLWMLQEAGMAPRWSTTDAPLAEDLNLTEALVEMYLRSVERLLRRSGLRRGYVDVDETSWTLRGRLRTADQLTRHQGRLLPLEVHYDDYTLDTAANRTLAAALEAVRTLPILRPGRSARGVRLALRAQGLLSRFEGVTLPVAASLPIDAGEGERHESYAGPLMLARLVLHGTGLASKVGDRRAEGLLLSMPDIFERCVAEILRGHFGPRLRTQASRVYAPEKDSSKRRVRPDLVVLSGPAEQPLTVLDTKYKQVELASADLYQMHVYARIFDTQDVVLLYAEACPPRMLRLEGSHAEDTDAIRLHVWGVDLTATPEEIRQQVLAASQVT